MINPASIIDLLLPPECHVCGETLLPGERFICNICLMQLPRTFYHLRENNPVEMRFAGKFPFEAATGHFFYSPDSDLAFLIHDFKYRNYPSLARRLGEVAAGELCNAGWLGGIDFIMPVPLHFFKVMRRGYNQSREIARGVSKVAGIALSRDLSAMRHHRTQTALSHEERVANTKDVFRLRHPGRYVGKRILLVDDVCTTGSTLTSAADAILGACPDVSLRLLTLAATF